MVYRHGDRNQMQLLPPSIEEYVGLDDPVRAYNAFVDSLSLAELGILWDEHKVGNSEYDPKAMIKLLVYGYSYGLRSSRKLEMATYHNLSFIWLMGGLKPDHKTIARFRKNNRTALKNILIPPVAVVSSMGLLSNSFG
jgi:transposase